MKKAIMLVVIVAVVLIFIGVFRISIVEVEYVGYDDLSNISDGVEGRYIGRQIFLINYIKESDKLEENPLIKEAYVYPISYNSVKVILELREPLLAFEYNGAKIIIDRDFVFVDFLLRYERVYVPVAEGLELNEPVLGQRIEVEEPLLLERYIKIAQSLKNVGLLDSTQSISVKDGSSVIELKKGLYIIIDKADDLEYKILFSKKIIDQLVQQGVHTGYIIFYGNSDPFYRESLVE